MEKAYLAAPFFTDSEIEIYNLVINKIKSLGYDLYVPREYVIEDAYELPNKTWGRKVFEEDVRAIREADILFVLNYGMYSDSGTAWECGFAYALDKKIINIICTKKEISLMMANGCDNMILLDDFLESKDSVVNNEQK